MKSLLLAFALFGLPAGAQPAAPPTSVKSLEGQIAELVAKKDPAAQIVDAVLYSAEGSNYLSDREREVISKSQMDLIEGRERETDDILDVFVRLKSRMPVLVAPAGAGKSAIAQRAVQKTLLRQYPDKPAYHEVFDNAHWVSIRPGSFMHIMKTNNEMSRMKAVDDFFNGIIALEQKLNTNIIVFIDEIHSLDSYQVEAMLPYIESQGTSVRVLGATNANKLGLALKDNDAFYRRIKQIPVPEFDDATTLELIKKTWIPKTEKKFEVKFDASALKRLIRFGMLLNPDGGKFDAAIKAGQDLAIWNLRGAHKLVLVQEDLFQFYKEKTRFPVDPFNKAELHTYLNDLETRIKSRLVGQDRMVHDTLEMFRDVILGSKKDMAVIGLVGPSGTGKSELGKLLASLGFNNPKSFLKIDANEYQNDDLSINKLLGAAGGLVTSNDRSGILPDFFDDPSQGKFGGVILIDEGEKAHPKFWQRLMEFFEEGQFRGGDGKLRFAKRHLVIITSNRGDVRLFPESMRTLPKARIMDHAAGITEAELKRQFQIRMNGRDEFQIPTSVLNRVDRWTVSTPLHTDDTNQIAENFARRQVADLEDHFQVKLNFDLAIARRISQIDFDPQYGARPIERGLSRFFNTLRNKMLASPENFKDKTFDVTQTVTSKDEGRADVVVDGKAAFTIPLPRIELDEPLESSAIGETLDRIRTILPKYIIGQDDAVNRVKDVLINFLSTPKKERGTLGIFLLGLTGVGKTEMAKATADALFGSPDRAEILPMGEIQQESDFNRLIGSAPGFVGSEQVRAFEKALQNHPEGGVIVLDEVTNMGGAIRELKEAMFKRLYNLFEEGKWTSSATGETYDLSKYVFFLTGNDGEVLFRGTTDDFLRLQTWKRANKPGEVHKMLLERGIPEAFLGRMADTILMKPLLRKETEQIAKKLLDPIFTRFEKLGYRMILPPDFNAEFGKMFFTQNKGARSLRAVAQNRMGTLIAEAIVAVRDQIKDKVDKWIKITIEDNIPTVPYITDPTYESKVTLNVAIGSGATELIAIDRPVTAFAAIDKRLSYKQARATAYHEAGHAVMNDPEITGMDLKHLTILGSEGNLGFAYYDNDDAPHRYQPPNEKQIDHTLARVFGGQVAMMMGGTDKDAGWAGDITQARKSARKYVVDWALDKDFLAIMTNEKGDAKLSENQLERASIKMEAIMVKAIQEAEATLTKKWDLVELVVAQLMTKGRLDEADFKAIKADWATRFQGQPQAQPVRLDCASQLVNGLEAAIAAPVTPIQ